MILLSDLILILRSQVIQYVFISDKKAQQKCLL